jgi:hypothetical protein
MAPGLFKKSGTQVKKFGIKYNIQVHQYIEDWLYRASMKEEVVQTTHSLLQLNQEIGWIVVLPKSELTPSQRFLSYRFDLSTGMVFPTETRFQKILLKANSLL